MQKQLLQHTKLGLVYIVCKPINYNQLILSERQKILNAYIEVQEILNNV